MIVAAPVLGSGTGSALRPQPGADGSSELVLCAGGTAVLSSVRPARITVLDEDGPRELAAGYAGVRLHSNRLVCAATLRMAGAEFRVHDVFEWAEPGLRLRRRVTVHVTGRGGSPPAGFASAFAWQAEPADPGLPPEWFLPGCVYRRNEQAPGYAIGARFGDAPLLVREDRLGLPVAARYDRGRGRVVALIHEAPSGSTVTADDLAAVHVSEHLGFGSFGDLNADELGFCFPGSEGAVSYPPMWTSGIGNSQADSPVNPFPPAAAAAGAPRGWTLRFHPVTAGFTHRYELVTVVMDAASFAGAVRGTWRLSWDLRPPRVRRSDLAEAERVSLDLLAASVVRDSGPGRPPAGIPTWVDVFTGAPGRLQDTFSTGFVGRNLEAAYVLLRAAERHGRPEWAAVGSELIGFWVAEAADGHSPGLCHTEWDRARQSWVDAGRKGVVYLRDQSEARNAVLAAAAWLRSGSRGRLDSLGWTERPDWRPWLDWCLAYGRWLADHTGRDGSLCRSYHLDGTPSDTSVNDGIHAAGFLARLATVTGEAAHAGLAERIAEFYWTRFHAAGVFAGGTLDNPNCCDREAASLAMDAYLALHRATGRRRWLEAAEAAAGFCESWIVGWDVPMHACDAQRQPFFDRDAWSAGLALITLGFSAVDTYLARHVGDFTRLAALTGDAHYRDVAALLLHNTKQMIQQASEYGYAAPGFQIEHWSIGRGRGYGLNSGWLPWVSTSHVLGIWDAEDLALTARHGPGSRPARLDSSPSKVANVVPNTE